MNYEVERKFRLKNPDELLGKLHSLGVTFADIVAHCDHYYDHPDRDFARTDEALRIRVTDGSVWLAYKGPRIDELTKTRQELEIPLGDQVGWEAVDELLQVLGFRPVAVVTKRRRPGTLAWRGREISLALDDVDRLGQFLELETRARGTARYSGARGDTGSGGGGAAKLSGNGAGA
jgi:adenylate cyclase class 2